MSKTFSNLSKSLTLVGLVSIGCVFPVHLMYIVPNTLYTQAEVGSSSTLQSLTSEKTTPTPDIILTNFNKQKEQIIAYKIPLPPISSTSKPISSSSTPANTSDTPSSTPVNSGQGDPTVPELRALIDSNCAKYSCNPDQLYRVMMCESGGKNHRDTYYKGPFQFLPSTFYANAKRIGIDNADVLDARQQVEVTAYMFGIGQAKQWGCK
jgi:hypothetical protein